MRVFFTVLGLMLCAATLAQQADAQAHEVIRFTGRLLDPGSQPITVPTDIYVRLYDSPTIPVGNEVFSESVNVSPDADGYFTHDIGSVNSLAGVDFQVTLYVGLEVIGDTELSPRYLLTSSPYAFHALDADRLGGLDSSEFVQLSAANNDFTGNVSALTFVASGSITAGGGFIGNLNGNATGFTGALAGDISGTMGATSIGNGKVVTAKLGALSVTTAKLADSSITTAKLADTSVSNAKLANNAVSTTKLQNNAVTTTKIANNAVDTTKLGADAVTTAKILNGTILGADLASNITILTSGTISAASFTGNGSALTLLNASNISSGTLADARLSGNVALRNVNNNFSVAQTINGGIQTNGGGGTFGGRVSITHATGTPDHALYVSAANGTSGAAGLFIVDTNSTGPAGSFIITNSASNSAPVIAADNISGTGPLLQLAKSGTPRFVVDNNGNLTVTGNITASGTITGMFSGTASNADMLDGLDSSAFALLSHTHDGADITSGTLSDARLSGNVALRGADNNFPALQTFANGLSSNGTTTINGSGGAVTTVGSFAGGNISIRTSASSLLELNTNQGELRLEGQVRINRIGPNNTLIGNNIGGDVDVTCADTNRIDINAGNGQLNLIGDAFIQGTSSLIITGPNFTLDANGMVTSVGLNVDSGTLSVDALLSRVGIGTVAPAAKLEIVASGETALLVNGKQAFSGADARLAVPQLATDPATDVANGMVYYNTATGRMRVRESGVWKDVVASGGSVIPMGGIIHGATASEATILASGFVRAPGADYESGPNQPSASAEGRYWHTAVWTGTELIIFGGERNGTLLGSGERYNPATDTWTTISNIGSPSPRKWHSAVWTGTEMIVWGGTDNSTELNNGARYNPATDSWTPVTNAGIPSLGLRSHQACWTGTEMLIHGGIGSGSNRGELYGYNPATDTWVNKSSVGAPSERHVAFSVWTGTDFLIWGGITNSGVVADGARYNYSTDTWFPITSTNAPSIRFTHQTPTHWTGSEMIVWGGDTGAGTVWGTGGRYNPATDTWTTMSMLNAPSARAEYGSVWTGGELIIWSGLGNGGIRLNDGARYNPSSDTWTALPSAGVPSERQGTQGVWTGSKTVFWGGYTYDSGLFMNTYPLTGGMYDPSTDLWTAKRIVYGYRKQ